MSIGILGHYGMLVGVALSPAQLIINAMDNEPSNDRKALITDTYNALDAAGIWSKADALCFRAAADLQAALLDWKLLISGSFTDPGTGGGLSADSGLITRKDGFGFGIQTPFDPYSSGVNYTQDDACVAVIVKNFTTKDSDEAYLVSGNETYIGFGTGAATTINFNINGYPFDTPATYSCSTADGYWVLNRTSSSDIALYHNGTLAGSATKTSSFPSGGFYQGAKPGEYKYTLNAEHVFLYAGASLDSTERAALQTIVNNYLAGL